MESKITREEHAIVKAEVTLPWEKAQPHFDKALSSLRSTVRLPGFRPGRAPTGLLLKRFKAEIGQDVARSVIPESLEEVTKEHDLQLISPPQLMDVTYTPNENFTFFVAFEVLPNFELKEWRGLELESLNTKVEDVIVEQELERRCQAAAVDEPVTDRGAQEGDIVKGHLTVIDQEAGETLMDESDYEIKLGAEEKVHPLLRDMALGTEVGAFREKVHEADADDPMDAWRGKTVKVFLETEHIINRRVPDLDEAFAKEQGFESLGVMREAVTEEIKKHFEDHEKQRVIGALLDRVLAQYDFEVPPSLIAEEAKAQVSRQLQPLQQYIRDRPLPKKTMMNLFESARPQAEQAVRLELVLNRIGDELEIKVSDEQVDEVLQEMLQGQTEVTLEDFKTQIENEHGLEEGLAPYRHHLKRRKTIDAILEAANITHVDTLTPPAETGNAPAEPDAAAEPVEKAQDAAPGSDTEG